MYVCVYVCMDLYFLKLHITAQSGPVILVILCHLHRSSQGGTIDTCYENLSSGATEYVCIFTKLHIAVQSGPVVLVILCHSH